MNPKYPLNPMQISHLSNSPRLKLLLVLKQNSIYNRPGGMHLGLKKTGQPPKGVDNMSIHKQEYQSMAPQIM